MVQKLRKPFLIAFADMFAIIAAASVVSVGIVARFYAIQFLIAEAEAFLAPSAALHENIRDLCFAERILFVFQNRNRAPQLVKDFVEHRRRQSAHVDIGAHHAHAAVDAGIDRARHDAIPRCDYRAGRAEIVTIKNLFGFKDK
jgi:hypothetical protein